jgi:2',3'-cyclic-nucleotide 2'-phosphodiesterase (5'-nucleotidase family)
VAVDAFVSQPVVSTTFKTRVWAAAAENENNTPLEVKRKKRSSGGGGGRAPSRDDTLTSTADDVEEEDDSSSIDKNEIRTAKGWKAKPCQPQEARLTILQITDVYTLEHLASFKTLLAETRVKSKGSKVISIITVRGSMDVLVLCYSHHGLILSCRLIRIRCVLLLQGDFLSPYLLSSVDRGQGMMNALNKIPMDYITWGNHEADISHKTVCKHVLNFRGTWLNSNMLDHAAMDAQKEFDVISVCSPDGSNSRKVGLVAVLSDDPKLYCQFKAPGAFGGATIDDPWETLERLQTKLMGPQYKCDTVIPLQHLYVPDDHITCEKFDFPVILSGHDHHRVDEVVHGTRLLKPGMDALYTTVLEMIWPDAECEEPQIKARFVKTSDWEPDADLDEENERAYDVLEPLRNTELASVPNMFQPLSSVNSRGSVTTMGSFICSLVKASMNLTRRQRDNKVDAVLLMGGNIRGGQDYEVGSFFSLEALEAEIKSDEVMAVVPMPGWLVASGIADTHAGDPIPGWMQYDNGITEDMSQNPPVVTHIANAPIDPDRIYLVATKVSDLTNGQSPSLTHYFNEHPEVLPPKGAYVNIQAELMSFFARNLWRRIWDALSETLDEECDTEVYEQDPSAAACNPERRLETLDNDEDGVVSVEDIQRALRDIVGLSVDKREQSLAEFVHDFADATGNGKITLEDIAIFCDEMGATQRNDSLGRLGKVITLDSGMEQKPEPSRT